MKVLFVCTGNSCRSVMAHFLLNHMAPELGLKDWEGRSCGIAAESYFVIPEGVHRALARHGIEGIKHTPQLVTRDLLRWADVVLPMTRMHREFMLDQFPEFTAKIHLFQEFALSESEDVEDPIGKPEPVYQECCDILEKGLRAVLERHVTKNH